VFIHHDEIKSNEIKREIISTAPAFGPTLDLLRWIFQSLTFELRSIRVEFAAQSLTPLESEHKHRLGSGAHVNFLHCPGR
jgi:hypothetical protein